jgi:hypothetical protein
MRGLLVSSKVWIPMGKEFTATGDVRAGVKESGVELPKAADKQVFQNSATFCDV